MAVNRFLRVPLMYVGALIIITLFEGDNIFGTNASNVYSQTEHEDIHVMKDSNMNYITCRKG